MEGTPAVASTKKNPSDFLKQIIGKPVLVQLNSGVTYKGVLACLDGYMNIALEQTEEYVEGNLKARYGDCFIRGNNGKTHIHILVHCPIHLFRAARGYRGTT